MFNLFKLFDASSELSENELKFLKVFSENCTPSPSGRVRETDYMEELLEEQGMSKDDVWEAYDRLEKRRMMKLVTASTDYFCLTPSGENFLAK